MNKNKSYIVSCRVDKTTLNKLYRTSTKHDLSISKTLKSIILLHYEKKK